MCKDTGCTTRDSEQYELLEALQVTIRQGNEDWEHHVNHDLNLYELWSVMMNKIKEAIWWMD